MTIIETKYLELYQAFNPEPSVSEWELLRSEIETTDEQTAVQMYFLISRGICETVEDVLVRYKEVIIEDETLYLTACRYFDSMLGPALPDFVQCYIDYSKFAYDLEVDQDFVEFEYNGSTYTCTNNLSL